MGGREGGREAITVVDPYGELSVACHRYSRPTRGLPSKVGATEGREESRRNFVCSKSQLGQVNGKLTVEFHGAPPSPGRV